MKVFKKLSGLIAIIAAIIAIFCLMATPAFKTGSSSILGKFGDAVIENISGYDVIFGKEDILDPSWVGIIGWLALLAGIIVGIIMIFVNKADYASVVLYFIATIFLFSTGAHSEPDLKISTGLIVPGVFALLAFLSSLIPLMLRSSKK